MVQHLIKILFVALLLLFPVLAQAETAKAVPVDIMPAHDATGSGGAVVPFKDSEATHPTLSVTPDKSEIIRLNEDAASVIIGNPLHANVIADSVRTLVVVPRTPGATYFTVLDKDGNVIMQRHVIVASPKEGYVRVKRTCNTESGDSCQSTSVFYCPDMCHEIGSQAEKDSKSDSSGDKATDKASKMADGEENQGSEGSSE